MHRDLEALIQAYDAALEARPAGGGASPGRIRATSSRGAVPHCDCQRGVPRSVIRHEKDHSGNVYCSDSRNDNNNATNFAMKTTFLRLRIHLIVAAVSIAGTTYAASSDFLAARDARTQAAPGSGELRRPIQDEKAGARGYLTHGPPDLRFSTQHKAAADFSAVRFPVVEPPVQSKSERPKPAKSNAEDDRDLKKDRNDGQKDDTKEIKREKQELTPRMLVPFFQKNLPSQPDAVGSVSFRPPLKEEFARRMTAPESAGKK